MRRGWLLLFAVPAVLVLLALTMDLGPRHSEGAADTQVGEKQPPTEKHENGPAGIQQHSAADSGDTVPEAGRTPPGKSRPAMRRAPTAAERRDQFLAEVVERPGAEHLPGLEQLLPQARSSPNVAARLCIALRRTLARIARQIAKGDRTADPSELERALLCASQIALHAVASHGHMESSTMPDALAELLASAKRHGRRSAHSKALFDTLQASTRGQIESCLSADPPSLPRLRGLAVVAYVAGSAEAARALAHAYPEIAKRSARERLDHLGHPVARVVARFGAPDSVGTLARSFARDLLDIPDSRSQHKLLALLRSLRIPETYAESVLALLAAYAPDAPALVESQRELEKRLTERSASGGRRGGR